jgi:hypothetical protein
VGFEVIAMTMPKKGTHQIVVDGTAYRWRIGKREQDGGLAMGDRIVVQAADGKGSILTYNLPWDFCDEPALTPRHVAEFIQNALSVGWKPDQAGPPFDYPFTPRRTRKRHRAQKRL